MRVVINLHEDGSFEVFTDDACKVYTVSDHTPNDRVYRLGASHIVGRQLVDEALRDDPIGHPGDARHALIKRRMEN